MNTAQFKVNESYSCRSACDYDCIWTFKVISRSGKFVTVQDESGKSKRCGISIHEGTETAFPMGRYSMAPVIRAA